MSKNKSFVYPSFSVIKSFRSVQIKANCRSPGDINHGLKIGDNYKHGKTVRYSCNAGFTLEGEAEVTCEEGTLREKKYSKRPYQFLRSVHNFNCFIFLLLFRTEKRA